MGLIEDAKAAKDRGMSYGEYMRIKEPEPLKLVVIRGLRCENCGAPLTKCQKRFCSVYCKNQMARKTSWGDYYV